MVQCAVVLGGFHLVVCYSVQWYWEDFVWWYVTVCSVTAKTVGWWHVTLCSGTVSIVIEWHVTLCSGTVSIVVE